MTYNLVAIDVSGIQQYLFGSNRLQENIGASEIVAQVTEKWVFDCLENLEGCIHNFKKPLESLEDYGFLDKSILDDNTTLTVEVIYAGGGNAVLIFAHRKHSKDFIKALTQKAVCETPGLAIVVARSDFKKSESLSEAYGALMKQLAQNKATRLASVPILGLGVTATCQSTGLPAVAIAKDNRLISAETQAKIKYADYAEERMQKLFGMEAKGFCFVRDFNKIGTPQDKSYLAVVHADGNGIGKRFKEIALQYPHHTDNPDFILALRQFSQFLRTTSVKAMQAILTILLDRINKDGGDRIVEKNLTISISSRKRKTEKQRYYILPFRPLIVGGDDTTFVCDGRLGLTLAALYLQKFHQATEAYYQANIATNGKIKGEVKKCYTNLHACAGVAIVHTHYPFARAYTLSETLIKRAKRYTTQKEKDEGIKGISAIDWHFAINGLLESLSSIREREYTVKSGSLTIRPLRISQPDYDVISWQKFREITEEFQYFWFDKWSKLKGLRQILREGPHSSAAFLRAYAYQLNQKLPIIKAPDDDYQRTGWQDKTCGYFDAIEAADYFINLERDDKRLETMKKQEADNEQLHHQTKSLA